jgi:type II secretory pathway pseudopilin PulG
MIVQWNNERGATLIEALAASAILGIIIVVFVQLSGYWSFTGTKSDTNAEALRLAEDQLNQAIIFARQEGILPDSSTISLNNHTYNVHFQSSPLAGNASVTYDTSEFQSNHVSSQGVVLLGSVPALVTVTISWGEAS